MRFDMVEMNAAAAAAAGTFRIRYVFVFSRIFSFLFLWFALSHYFRVFAFETYLSLFLFVSLSLNSVSFIIGLSIVEQVVLDLVLAQAIKTPKKNLVETNEPMPKMFSSTKIN